MELPPGVEHGFIRKGNICKLKRSLYGLKQSPRAWFGRFASAIMSVGYMQSNSDHTLFIKHEGGKVTALAVYVDDMVLTGKDPEKWRGYSYLASKFEMKGLGMSRQGIFLSQRNQTILLRCVCAGSVVSYPQLAKSSAQLLSNQINFHTLLNDLVANVSSLPLNLTLVLDRLNCMQQDLQCQHDAELQAHRHLAYLSTSILTEQNRYLGHQIFDQAHGFYITRPDNFPSRHAGTEGEE
ncbi:hypothetical protein RJ639_029951 [Escallonia herrerae]|uniref:Reverse transcriptase Ty1/copia-type domain-containing protein n=1 Tax=Escallonia herrerae TaxID=1293975 RepID=A0AA88XG27_9ASTE|nr:hypothetical protein RJ639_029951 [Escallonia herrerae]